MGVAVEGIADFGSAGAGAVVGAGTGDDDDNAAAADGCSYAFAGEIWVQLEEDGGLAGEGAELCCSIY